MDVTLIDRTNHHLFQPLLYQVATGVLSEGQVAPPIREVLRRYRHVQVELGDVSDIDLADRTVIAVRPFGTLTVPYDHLIVAAGSSGSYFGHDGFGRYAPRLKTIDDALELRGRIFGAFEMAEVEEDPEQRRAWLTFAVVGGGPTGVEIAGQIAELSRRSLQRNFRKIDPRSARVILCDAGDEILATFGDRLSGKASAELERLGVEIARGPGSRPWIGRGSSSPVPPARSGSRAGRRSGRPGSRRPRLGRSSRTRRAPRPTAPDA